MKCTKGKWEVDDILVMSDNTCVARVFQTYYPEESQEANAHLIAAAPDLEKACKETRAWLGLMEAYLPLHDLLLKNINKALAKAKE